jgi:ubiquinone/menaquinone biosynthesis C-methylase UbiE
MRKDYNEFWKEIAKKKDWINYILPTRTDKEFWDEGKKQAEVLSKFIKPDFKVVDLGCGIGRVLTFISAKYRIGVDVCQEFLDKIKDKDIIKLKTDGRGINIDNNAVDFVYSLMMFQHTSKEDHHFYIEEIYRILRTGGKALIQFPKEGYYKQSSFVNTYTWKELIRIAKPFKKFTIKEDNLVGYGDRANLTDKTREYFLILEK